MAPFGARTTAEAFDPPGSFEITKKQTNHIPADRRTKPLNIRNAEGALECLDGMLHQFGLGAARTFDLAEALFKFLAGLAEDKQEKIDRGPTDQEMDGRQSVSITASRRKAV